MASEKELKMSSTSGMNSTKSVKNTKNILTVNEVIEIIKVSAENRVSSLKLGDLEIAFELKPIESKLIKPIINEISQQAQETQSEEDLEALEIEQKRDRIAMMMIENPALAEELIAEGELIDGDDDGDDGDGD